MQGEWCGLVPSAVCQYELSASLCIHMHVIGVTETLGLYKLPKEEQSSKCRIHSLRKSCPTARSTVFKEGSSVVGGDSERITCNEMTVTFDPTLEVKGQLPTWWVEIILLVLWLHQEHS